MSIFLLFLKSLFKLGLKLYYLTWNGYSITYQIHSLTAWYLEILLIHFLLLKNMIVNTSLYTRIFIHISISFG